MEAQIKEAAMVRGVTSELAISLDGKADQLMALGIRVVVESIADS